MIACGGGPRGAGGGPPAAESGDDGSSGAKAGEDSSTSGDPESGSEAGGPPLTSGAEETGEEPACDGEILPEAHDCGGGPTPHPACNSDLAPIIQLETEALYFYAGRFTRGDAPVYRGMFAASATGGGGDAAAGEAIAAITREEAAGLAAGFEQRLTVFFTAEEKKVKLAQPESEPTTTGVWPPQSLGTSGGIPAECVGCLLDLSTEPDALTINVNASGEDVQRQANGTLERVDPRWLTLDEVRLLAYSDPLTTARIEHDTELDGEQLVVHREGEFRLSVPATPGNTWCDKVTDYRARWFFDLECPGKHGVSDIIVDEHWLCCEPDIVDPGGQVCEPL